MAKQTSSLAKIIPLRSAEAMASSQASSELQKTSKEIDQNQKERDEKQLKSQEKVISNLDRLVVALQNNSGAKVSGNKAAELGRSVMPNYKQGGTWDQRSVKDQAADFLKGRAGTDGKRDAFDPNSLRYKFGSLKGIADTTGLVQPDSFFGNLLGRREDRMKRTDTLTKLNPQMKNLKQFGGDESKVRDYYDKQYKEQFAPSQAKLQGEQYKLDSLMASGISESELEKTIGGKKQIKARDAAAADMLLSDKMKKAEVKELSAAPEMTKSQGFAASGIGASNVIPFPTKSSSDNFMSGSEKETELENIRLMGEQNSVLKVIQENTAAMPQLLRAFQEETKRETAADQAQLEATAAGGGSGSGIMDMAGDLLGKGKGALGKAGGFLKGAGGFLAKRAGPLAAIASVAAGGVTAYQGYNAASEKEAKGEITKDEATVEKGGAIGEGAGQAAGGAVGALKGAAVGAAIGSVVPVIGTAIGGVVGAAIGGIGGSFLGGKAGKFLGETGGKIKNWFSSSNPDKSGAEAKVATMTAAPQQQEPDVVFARRKLEREQSGGSSIAGYEKGYNLSGKKEDVDAAAAEYEKFDKAAREGDTAAMDAAANNFKQLAQKIQSPEYKAKMKEISDIQQARKGNKGKAAQGKETTKSDAATTPPPAVTSMAAAPAATTPKAGAANTSDTKSNTATAPTTTAAAPSGVSPERMKMAESARQNALDDGASPQEADMIAQKMLKYGNVISAGQGRGDVYQPIPTSAKVAAAPVKIADRVATTSAENQAAKEQPAAASNVQTNVSQTNVQQRNTQAVKPPIRNQDSSYGRMVDRRYAY